MIALVVFLNHGAIHGGYSPPLAIAAVAAGKRVELSKI